MHLEAYVRAVRQRYHKSPDLISEEELRRYFRFIKNVNIAPNYNNRVLFPDGLWLSTEDRGAADYRPPWHTNNPAATLLV
jgi:hypothetical protein